MGGGGDPQKFGIRRSTCQSPEAMVQLRTAPYVGPCLLGVSRAWHTAITLCRTLVVAANGEAKEVAAFSQKGSCRSKLKARLGDCFLTCFPAHV